MQSSSKLLGFELNKEFRIQTDLFVCAVIFLVANAGGLLTKGYGIDDWMQMDGADNEWVYSYGRWATHALSAFFFGGHFMIRFQLFVAFLVYLWISRILARYAIGSASPLAVCLIFAVGTNHFYLIEAMSYSSHVMGYAIALGLSVMAFHLLNVSLEGSLVKIALQVIVAAQLLAISLGLYQTYALLGGMVLALVVFRAEEYSLSRVLRLCAVAAVASVLALVLHFVELWLYQTVTHIWPPATAPKAAFFARDLLETIGELPDRLVDLHSMSINEGWVSGDFPDFLRRVQQVFFAGIFLCIVLAVLSWVFAKGRSTNQRLEGILRVSISSFGALFVLPILFLLIVDAYLAARAFGYIGFIYASLALACIGTIRGNARDNSPLQHASIAISTLLIGVAIFYGWITSAVWDDRARIDARNRALTNAIVNRVTSLVGYDGHEIEIFGSRQYPDLSWGGELGSSLFVGAQTNYQIFKELYGLPLPVGIETSPKPCPAFPADGSVFLSEGKAVVCLTASE